MIRNSFKQNQKVLILAMVLALSIAVFPGCGKREEEKKEKPAVPEKEVKVEKKAPVSAVKENLEVSYVQGEVNVIEGEGVGAAVAPGKVLRPGSQIKTEPQSQTDLELPDGGLKIRIKENSDAIGGSFAMKKKLRDGDMDLKRGTTYVKIDRATYQGTFSIKTPTLEVTAVGTAFCVEVYGEMGDAWVGVVEGELEVKNLLTLETTRMREGESLEFDAIGQRLAIGAMPEDEKDYLKREIQRIGSRLPEELEPKIELVLPSTKERLETFLTSAAISTNGKEPRRVHSLLMKALRQLEEGMTEENKEVMLESARKMESALLFYSDPRYAPQLMMFVAVYYRNLREYDEAAKLFEKVYTLYPDSAVASVAMGAEARVYEEDLKNYDRAEMLYMVLLDKYGESLEREAAMDGLDRVRDLKRE